MLRIYQQNNNHLGSHVGGGHTHAELQMQFSLSLRIQLSLNEHVLPELQRLSMEIQSINERLLINLVSISMLKLDESLVKCCTEDSSAGGFRGVCEFVAGNIFKWITAHIVDSSAICILPYTIGRQEIHWIRLLLLLMLLAYVRPTAWHFRLCCVPRTFSVCVAFGEQEIGIILWPSTLHWRPNYDSQVFGTCSTEFAAGKSWQPNDMQIRLEWLIKHERSMAQNHQAHVHLPWPV